jgi:hypothetical protein
MNISRPLVVSLLVAVLILFVGMLFWPFILSNVIKPIALVVWLLLRILVLSVDQKYFWYGIVFVAFYVLIRLLPGEQPVIRSNAFPETNATINRIGYWRILFTYNGQNVRDEKTLKRELIYMLTSFYKSKQSTSNHLDVYDALQKGEIPLPENIHAFLFSQESQESGGQIRKFLQSIRKIPTKWIRQWTGQEKAEHFRMIDEVLNLMETLLEIKHDDTKRMQIEH